jgi:hypothetical protein
MRDEAAKNRIAQWTEERYRISNARKNWQKLSDLYDLYIQKKPLYEIRKKLIKYITLRDLADRLRDRFAKKGNDQFKEGVKYVIRLKYLKKLFEDFDDINRQILLKEYLNKWNKISKKLKKRDDKLRDAMDEIEKKQLTNDVNTVASVMIVKRFKDAIPVARAYDFFDKLREIVIRRNKSEETKTHLLIKIIDNAGKFSQDYLKKIIRKWFETADKIKDKAVKNRIAKWTEERYRISNARKNWEKLSDLYDLYNKKRPLYDLRKRLIKYMTLRELADRLRDRFTKAGNDQFKKGVKYVTIIKYLKDLIQDIDDINRQMTLKKYLDRWINNVEKLKEREKKLLKAMDEIEKRQLIKDVDTVANVEVTKRFRDAIPVARATEFFKILKELEKKRKHLNNYKTALIGKTLKKSKET